MPALAPALSAASGVLPGGVEPWDWLRAGIVLVVTLVLAAVARRAVERLFGREGGDPGGGRAAGRFLSLVVVAVGLVYVLVILGVRIGPLVGALGLGGIALAFALQDILQNFVAGLLIQLRRPFRRGEQVQLGDYEGVVEDVNLRTVQLHTYDGLVVYLPNATVLQGAIVNYTRTPLSRTELEVGVAYDTDLPVAQRVLLEAVTNAAEVSESPPPEVWAWRFDDSAIVFAVRYWHSADIASRWRVRSQVAVDVKAALDRAGITIPFPQVTLWHGAPTRD